LILKRTGPGETDLNPCAVIRGKSAEEVDDAIAEGATEGEGDYVALSVNGMVERTLRMKLEVAAPETSAE
jgi:hypothetical protein